MSRWKHSDRVQEDKISHFPDEIFHYILSFLSKRYAVATCICLSRWKLLWTWLTNLRFSDRHTSTSCLNEKYRIAHNLPDDTLTWFQNFLSRVLLSSSGDVDKFYLSFLNIRDLSLLKFWVSHAIELHHSSSSGDHRKHLKLSSWVLIFFFFGVPPSGKGFPNVKILNLEVFLFDRPMTKNLFSVCPVIEDLSTKVYAVNIDPAIHFTLSSPTLKRLTFHLVNWGPRGFSDLHKIMIRAPNVAYLWIFTWERYENFCLSM